ncbi:MAG: hypothetical protein M1820_001527 [Bogoriella megaspora]|nr:MAG: hypothetical protein M1820_001527 [Bogoriella megaspora]
MASVSPNTEFTTSNIADFFNKLGVKYELAFSHIPDQAASIHWLTQELPPNSKILDIGCGTGRPVISTLAAAGHSVHGIDVAPGMIDIAKEQVPNATFEVIDVRDMPEEPEKWDAVVSYFALLAAITRDEIRSVLGKIHKNMKPGGLLLFATVPADLEDAPFRFLGWDAKITSMSESGYIEAVENVGFEILNTTSAMFQPKAVEAGICGPEDEEAELQFFIYARKKKENQ